MTDPTIERRAVDAARFLADAIRSEVELRAAIEAVCDRLGLADVYAFAEAEPETAIALADNWREIMAQDSRYDEMLRQDDERRRQRADHHDPAAGGGVSPLGDGEAPPVPEPAEPAG